MILTRMFRPLHIMMIKTILILTHYDDRNGTDINTDGNVLVNNANDDNNTVNNHNKNDETNNNYTNANTKIN